MKRVLALCFALLILLASMAFPAQAESTPFTDISENTDYYNGIVYLYNIGLMNGTSPTTFSPSSMGRMREASLPLPVRVSGMVKPLMDMTRPWVVKK